MSTTATLPTSAAPRSRVRRLGRRTAREGAYVLLDLPVGVVAFSVMLSALTSGLSLAVTLVGIPILAASLWLARGAARLERRRAGVLLGATFTEPPARPTATTTTGRVLAPLRDSTAWRACSYFLLMLPVGTATFTAAVAWVGGSLVMVTLPLWSWTQPHGGPKIGDGSYWSSPGRLAASAAAGLVLLCVTPFVIHQITKLDRALLRLIGGRP